MTSGNCSGLGFLLGLGVGSVRKGRKGGGERADGDGEEVSSFENHGQDFGFVLGETEKPVESFMHWSKIRRKSDLYSKMFTGWLCGIWVVEG